MSDFRDSTVTLAFEDSVASDARPAESRTGPPAVIQILNDDPLPSVSLATAAIAIDEGMSRDRWQFSLMESWPAR